MVWGRGTGVTATIWPDVSEAAGCRLPNFTQVNKEAVLCTTQGAPRLPPGLAEADGSPDSPIRPGEATGPSGVVEETPDVSGVRAAFPPRQQPDVRGSPAGPWPFTNICRPTHPPRPQLFLSPGWSAIRRPPRPSHGARTPFSAGEGQGARILAAGEGRRREGGEHHLKKMAD